MTDKTAEFVELIDRALQLAEPMVSAQPSQRLNHLISALQTIKAHALTGQLQPADGSATLGLAREVADWIEPLDSPLLPAVGAIEQYFQQFF